jgi:hypothetical protein
LAERTTPERVTHAATVPLVLALTRSAPFAGPAALMTKAASASTMAGDGRRIDRFIVLSLSR